MACRHEIGKLMLNVKMTMFGKRHSKLQVNIPSEEVVETGFQLDWKQLNKLYIPNIESVRFTIKAHKGTGII